MQEFEIRGRHYAADLYGVRSVLLDDEAYLRTRLEEAAEVCGATVLRTESEKFEPSGVTVACILSESHITCHTYPEKGFIALDCYTCGENADPKVAIEYLILCLQPSEGADIQFLERGRRGI